MPSATSLGNCISAFVRVSIRRRQHKVKPRSPLGAVAVSTATEGKQKRLSTLALTESSINRYFLHTFPSTPLSDSDPLHFTSLLLISFAALVIVNLTVVPVDYQRNHKLRCHFVGQIIMSAAVTLTGSPTARRSTISRSQSQENAGPEDEKASGYKASRLFSCISTHFFTFDASFVMQTY